MRQANGLLLQVLLCVFVVCEVSWLFNSSATADTIPVCSGDLFNIDCRDQSNAPLDLRKSTGEADGVLFNYFLITQPQQKAAIEAFNTMPGKPLQDQALKIADETRKAAILYVTGGTAEEKWSPQVRIAVQRLRLLKFRVSEASSSDCFATGDPGIPNARYRYHEHTVGICPASLKIPTAELAASLAHEVGHSVSPCMLSKPLVRYKNANRDYGVDVDPATTDELLKLDEAERLIASDISDPPAYRQLNACLDARYKTDYEDWLARSTLFIEKASSKLSPSFQKLIDRARARTPQRCYEKTEEHFADSFGAFTYDAWASSRELSSKATRTGLHPLINMQCAHRFFPNHIAFKNDYPSDATRLGLQLKPIGIAARLGCSVSPENICSLNETSFRDDVDSGPEVPSGAAQGSGTKP